MTMIQKTRGFTLIELIIAITIVLILAALAIPNYRGHVLRSNRSDAMAALLHVGAAQEKFYLQNNTYTNDLGATGLNVGTHSPNEQYDVTVTGANANGFVATATPPDPGQGQGLDSECTSFSVDQQGNKTATGSGSNPSAHCWR